MPHKKPLLRWFATVGILLLGASAPATIAMAALPHFIEPGALVSGPLAPAAILFVDRSDDANVTTCSGAANDCTLRGAINKVATIGISQTIQFLPAISQINLSSPLPTVNMTGTIIQGASGVPRINGAGLAGSGDDIFTVDTSGSRISGLTLINGNRSDIMVKSGAGNQIDHNYLGVANPSATTCLTAGATRKGSVGIWLQEEVSASGSTSIWIYGNVIGCHVADGIFAVGADDAKIGIDPAGAASGNWIGTTVAKIGGSYTGETLPNRHGISFSASGADGSRRNIIRNNVVANNAQIGVLLQGNGVNNINSTSGNTIAANLIIGNLTGVWLSNGAFLNVIGGATDGDGNTIYANTNNGINVYDSDLNGILGNTIGAQDPAMANNGISGILISNGASNWIGGVFVLIIAFERGNIIAGNGQSGVWLAGARNTTITRNWIGNTPAGAIRPNGGNGIIISEGSYSNTIGNLPAQINVIGGNTGDGIVIDGAATMSNTVVYNDIGLNSALANLALPNQRGVVLSSGAHHNTVAGGNWIATNHSTGVMLASGATRNQIGPNNLIFGNSRDGIAFSGSNTDFNTILTSTIHSNALDGIREYGGALNNNWIATALYANGGLGIDQAAETSSGNIPTAGWPVITSMVRAGGFVTLTGTSDASVSGPGFANTTKVYVFSDGLDPSGYGEGQNYKGEAQTNSAGVWKISLSEGGSPRCYAAYKRTAGFLFSTYDYGSEFSPSTCALRAYLPTVRR
ncbi:MAG: right-handed parallel beta-helix repeat-containing protein [Thermoflexales bacterium]